MYDEGLAEYLFILYTDLRYSFREYRPEAVAAVYNKEKKVLMTQSREHRVWAPLQEGIRKGESLRKGFLRGLEEEVGVLQDDLDKTSIVLGFYRGCLITRGRSRDDFSGKEYFYSTAEYVGDDNLKKGPEVSDFDWMRHDEVIDNMRSSGVNEDKIQLTENALEILHDKGLVM